jgi:Holliday junction DNA helicase RuvB
MTTQVAPQPVTAVERSKNPLRPTCMSDVVGQEKAKRLLKRAMAACYTRRQPLPHCLFVGPGGTGKSTLSHVVAAELGVDVYEVEAPVSYDTLLELRTQMYDGDILRIEEIHQQAIMERRGRNAATNPETLYSIMEDRVMQTQGGPLEFPHITIIGTTTDEGMLPDSFVDRFPVRPRLVPYTVEEMEAIAHYNALQLGVLLDNDAGRVFADASRRVPRVINNFMTLAAMFGGHVTRAHAYEVLADVDVTRDGLTADMQRLLTFLLTHCRYEARDGEVKHQAGLNTLATALGKSRDSKAVALRIEPWLIERGFLQVTPSGRRLTQRGIERAERLLEGLQV